MNPNLNRTFSLKNGLTIKSSDGSTFSFFSGKQTPESFDDGSIPVSSLYAQSNGTLYQKQPDSTWQSLNVLNTLNSTNNINNVKPVTLEPIMAMSCCGPEIITTIDGDIITGEI